eukprot:snap_masked-scaffold_42-processed-gene-1.26-mRNA-1 protein AED:1.00 eAED:1.00 QI:0/0/0/0/1/1/2/0/66
MAAITEGFYLESPNAKLVFDNMLDNQFDHPMLWVYPGVQKLELRRKEYHYHMLQSELLKFPSFYFS